MPQFAAQQLDSIHSMLSAGQRNLRVERHSLVLWGLSCGILILIRDRIFTAEQFPSLKQQAFAWLILLALTVSGVALIDWHLTRHVKQARDETWSFIHRQILKVLWLLMSIGVLLTFATFFYGGGHMTLSAWVVLCGIGLYVHGLFSEELLEWIGVLMIAIGIGMLGLHLHYPELKWVAASTLGLGLPLLATMLDHGQNRSAWFRLIQSAGWLLCVLLPLLLAQRISATDMPPNTPVVSLEEFRQHPDRQQVVALPAGSTIPVKIEVSGNVFNAGKTTWFPLVLNAPVEVMMSNGQSTGYWRSPGANWESASETYSISIPWIKTELTAQHGAEVRTSLIVETQHRLTP